MAKKKKKTAAQAASARYEQTEESLRRAQAKERSKLIRESAEAAQRRANKSVGFRMIVPMVLVFALIIFALVFTIGPGVIMGQ